MNLAGIFSARQNAMARCAKSRHTPDFHAVFEAFLGGRWYLFDPTELAPRSQVTRIGTGRDATDVAFATIFGTAQMTQMSPKVKILEQNVEHVAVAIATT